MRNVIPRRRRTAGARRLREDRPTGVLPQSPPSAAAAEFDPGRVGATVSPEPQADSSRKRISGPNVTPAGPESNLPDDDDDDDGLPSHDGLPHY